MATLTMVDVASRWTERWPAWGTAMMRVRQAVQRAGMSFPFSLRKLYTDNGGEFINQTLYAWCKQHGIRFTRGRAYRKNDQAWVEQRKKLASAIFEWIGARYNPRRRHTSIDNLSPVDYERLYAAAADAA